MVWGVMVWSMVHPPGPRRHPTGGVITAIFCLLILITFIGWAGLLLLALGAGALVLIMRGGAPDRRQR